MRQGTHRSFRRVYACVAVGDGWRLKPRLMSLRAAEPPCGGQDAITGEGLDQTTAR